MFINGENHFIEFPEEGHRTHTICKYVGTDYTAIEVSKHPSYSAASDALKTLHVETLKQSAVTRKRAKTVFPTDEIPHLWMHKVQGSARNAGGNLYFNGDTIYSYGSHFPLAIHVQNAKGKPAILINSGSYSVTTSGHQSAVRQAIPSDAVTFTVPYLSEDRYLSNDHARNVKHFQDEIEQASIKASRARSNRDRLLGSAVKYAESLKAYCTFFGLKCPKVKLYGVNDLPSLEADLIRKQIAETKKRKAEEKQRELAAIKAAEEGIAAFRAGEDYSRFNLYNVPTMLRIKGDEVETSRGVRIPIDYAVRGLRFVRAVIAKGEDWQSNGHTFHLGHYVLDRVSKDGTIKAGCHVITLDEIERIAPELEAVKVTGVL
jgi:hypothetical protein